MNLLHSRGRNNQHYFVLLASDTLVPFFEFSYPQKVTTEVTSLTKLRTGKRNLLTTS